MDKAATVSASVDQYIAGFPPDMQPLLKKVRAAIRKAAPNAEEVISYRIPAYRQAGMLIFFAGFKKHIGLYPAPCDAPELKKALAPYRSTKTTARFPLDRPIPYADREGHAIPSQGEPLARGREEARSPQDRRALNGRRRDRGGEWHRRRPANGPSFPRDSDAQCSST